MTSAIVALALAASSGTDTLRLANGAAVAGKLVAIERAESGPRVRFSAEGAVLQHPLRDVRAVELADGTTIAITRPGDGGRAADDAAAGGGLPTYRIARSRDQSYGPREGVPGRRRMTVWVSVNAEADVSSGTLRRIAKRVRAADRGSWDEFTVFVCLKDQTVGVDTAFAVAEFSDRTLRSMKVNAEAYRLQRALKSARQQRGKPPPRSPNKFVASRKSDVYHRPSCSSVRRILQDNIVNFRSASHARASGRRPCKVCRPPDEQEP